MKSYIPLLFLFWGQFLSAQTFTKVSQLPHFEQLAKGSIAFADVDGDNDQDLLMTGVDGFSKILAKLYLNDGNGNFNEKIGTSFVGVFSSAIAFADVDGDNDQDVLITGRTATFNNISKLYLNDGMGNFTEKTGTPFVGVEQGSIAFADINGDNDQDVLITGRAVVGSPLTIKLYTNNGMGTFTEKTGTPFVAVYLSSLAFSDVDGDNDEDVLITGWARNMDISKLYLNDGFGNFTEKTGTPFEAVRRGAISFSDVDGDNDQDVFITGHTANTTIISKLYTNDGMGNFTEKTGTPIPGIISGSSAFLDIDRDSDEDLFIIGNDGSNFISKLYTNDGMGNFIEKPGTSFVGLDLSTCAIADVDRDNYPDIMIMGKPGSFDPVSKLYTNDGMGNYAEKAGIPFNGLELGSIAFADIDGDNDQDVLIIGRVDAVRFANLYTNDGTGHFTEKTGTPFLPVYNGSVNFSDVDRDNDQDVLITGWTGTMRTTKLFLNDGAGNFTEKMGGPFVDAAAGSVAFSDVDGDNDEDVLITGWSGSQFLAKLYINHGMTNFTEKLGTPFDGVEFSSIAFADVDGDNDQDVLITGWNGTSPISKLYTNDGMGNYTEKLGTPFQGVQSSSIAFADVDGDHDQDVLITGWTGFVQFTKLYINDGMANFTEKVGTPFLGVAGGSVAFSDVDGDNDQDVLMTGWTGNFRIAKLYLNDGMANFAEDTRAPFVAVNHSAIAFADVDGDNDEDVLITGFTGNVAVADLYINDGMVSAIENGVEGLGLDFVLFPNPTSADNIQVKYASEKMGSLTLIISDLTGRRISQQQEMMQMGAQTFSIDIATLAKGSYIMQLDDGERKGVGKFVVR